ncbi:MAG: polysaccharide biosynthesis protein [Bacteriovoracaceae bacterium]
MINKNHLSFILGNLVIVLAVLFAGSRIDWIIIALFILNFVVLEKSALNRVLVNSFNESDYKKVFTYSISLTLSFLGLLILKKETEFFEKALRFFIFLSFGNILFRTLLKKNRIQSTSTQPVINTLIIGAGNAGEQIVNQLRNRNEGYKAVAIVDDNPSKFNKTICSVPVVGSVKDIPEVSEKYSISLALIAIPSATHAQISTIVQTCIDCGISVKTLPDTFHVLNDTVNLAQFRDITIDDLLTRNSIQLDTTSISNYIAKRHVLVTGAGGSIGSELSFQAAKLNCQEITLVDNNEFGLYEIDLKLRELFPTLKINSVIGDVRDFNRISSIVSQVKPHVVFHAAAYKHVPLMEHNPIEAINTNVKGTLNILKASQAADVEQFIFISTDKAVNPTNVMGTTKRLAEILIQQNSNGKTKCNIVRFGNVLNSRGSVIPRFLEQIKRGGPITVTHKDITRYFMSIPEAVQLVLKAASFERNKEIFILDMGEPVKIYEMAFNLIKLHGLVPDRDIKIEVTGLRPGEKLYEELLADAEKTTSTPESKIRAAMVSSTIVSEELVEKVLNLNWNDKKEDVVKLLKDLVPEFSPEVT